MLQSPEAQARRLAVEPFPAGPALLPEEQLDRVPLTSLEWVPVQELLELQGQPEQGHRPPF